MDGAPTSFFDVERERRSRIWLLFATLVGVFFVGVWVLTLCIGLAASVTIFDTRALWLTYTPPGLVTLLLCSAGVAWLYWRLSRVGAQERLLAAMNARPIDPSDRFHQRLKNIVDEIAAAGGCPRLRCVVVPTVGMNAFAFSDFAGGGTIGVTEGALARLSREQLQGVVAHEAAHVLSGDCVTVTAACLLFGVYSSAMAGLSDLASGSENDQAAIGGVPGVGPQPGFLLLSGVFALLAMAVALINSAISRQREYRADAAAVRYTRDPLGLAQALGMMARHPGGAGCIPWGLAALCIRPTGSSAYGWLDRLTETHPPIDRRVAVLLRLAAASTASFASRSSEAEEALEQREHVLRPPATVGGAMVAAALGPGLLQATAGLAGTASASTASSAAGPHCPACGATLRPADYEGVAVLACQACGGRLASPQAIGRILARREVGFTDEQRRLAVFAASEGDHLRRQAILSRGRDPRAFTPCPLCGKSMVRRHYDLQHAVEVDSCQVCERIWFDKDELEVLQLLVEGEVG
jgi:Zn-dependent protease with chaperone function/Zn-finger nucleic acid-binding protein